MTSTCEYPSNHKYCLSNVSYLHRTSGLPFSARERRRVLLSYDDLKTNVCFLKMSSQIQRDTKFFRLGRMVPIGGRTVNYCHLFVHVRRPQVQRPKRYPVTNKIRDATHPMPPPNYGDDSCLGENYFPMLLIRAPFKFLY